MEDYVSRRCRAQHLKRNPAKFWDTIKPFMTNKSKSCNENITLKHNGKIVNNPNDVCDIFNGYYTNVALEIGSEENMNEDEELDQIFKMYQNHASIISIQEHISIDSRLRMSVLGKLSLYCGTSITVKPRVMTQSLLNWWKLPQTNLLNPYLL